MIWRSDFEYYIYTIRFQQAVNDEIRRTCRQLASNIKLQESQINMLASVKNSVLHAQRENLSQLQVYRLINKKISSEKIKTSRSMVVIFQIEHNMQKQMLKTLQQDHHKMQMHAKHFGI